MNNRCAADLTTRPPPPSLTTCRTRPPSGVSHAQLKAICEVDKFNVLKNATGGGIDKVHNAWYQARRGSGLSINS